MGIIVGVSVGFDPQVFFSLLDPDVPRVWLLFWNCPCCVEKALYNRAWRNFLTMKTSYLF